MKFIHEIATLARNILIAFTIAAFIVCLGIAINRSRFVVETQASYYATPGWECASNDFSPGTLLEVTHADRTIIVRVAGSFPGATPARRLDLSAPAFAALAEPKFGVIDVTVEGRDK